MHMDEIKDLKFPAFNFSTPELPGKLNYSLADTCYEHVTEEVMAFQKELDDEHEVGIMLTSFGKNIVMAVDDIGYQNPNLLYFYGTVDGSYAQLIQHMSQLNFLLIAVKKQEPDKPPRRIGFTS